MGAVGIALGGVRRLQTGWLLAVHAGARARSIRAVSAIGAPARPALGDRARSTRLSPPATAALGGLIALAAALRFALIGHQGYWFDEGNTVLLVHFSPGKMLGLIPQTEDTPPFYYCVAWVWARIFGFQEAGLRSLSATVGVLTVPVVYLIAAKLRCPRTGLVAAALAACNPLLVWYSQEARAYSMLVFFSALSLLAFVWLLQRPTARRALAWALAGALALATHYFAIMIVAPEAAWLLYRQHRSRCTLGALAFVVAVGAALLPYALGQKATGHANWIAAAPLTRRLGQLIPEFVAGFALPANAVLEPLAVALAVLGAALAIALTSGAQRRLAAVCGGVALAAMLLNLLVVALGFDYLLTRNLLEIWPPAALAVACGLAARRAGRLGIAAAVVLCAVGVAGVIDFDATPGLQRPDWRVVARALATPVAGGVAPPRAGAIVPLSLPAAARGPLALTGVAPGARVILIQHYRDLLPLSLYMPHLKFLAHGSARVRELDVVSFTSPPSAGFCWWGSACNLWPSQMQASYAVPGFRAVSRTHALQFTILRMVARRPQTIDAAVVARALHDTTINEDDLLIQRP